MLESMEALQVSNIVYIATYLHICFFQSIGRVEISDDLTLTVNSDLNGDSSQFTLTCISTGGPATTVTWTKDSTITITEGTLQTVLNDTMTALYTHTLTVTGRDHGLYSCTVENTVSSDSATYTVQGLLTCFCTILAWVDQNWNASFTISYD